MAASSCAVSSCSRSAATSDRHRPPTVWGSSVRLKALVIRTRTALGRDPGNLIRVGLFDVARLAVHAIRGIDLQFPAPCAVVDHFVDVGGTEIGTRVAEFLDAGRRTEV